MQKHRSLRYLRCHSPLSSWVVDGEEIGCKVYSEDEAGNPSHDFSRINRLYGEWVRRGIKPVVEVDSFPAELSVKLDEEAPQRDEGAPAADRGPKSWRKWRDLIEAFVRNLVDTFGIDEVRTWYFEVWNEPDGWPHDDLPTFFRMYDVFSETVKSVDDTLRVGGPACFHESFLKLFLEHVIRGTNHVTGRRGSRLDFISYHIYGLSGGWLGPGPVIQPQVQRFTQGVLWIARLLARYELPEGCEFHLNEWGLCSNFYRTVRDFPELEYRNSEASALFIAKLVDCLWHIEDRYGLETSMMLYWGFTYEARQEVPFLGQRSLTTAGNVPKPILAGYELMARLGETRLKVDGHMPGARLGGLATRGADGALALLVYDYEETDDDLDFTDSVEIRLANVEGDSITAALTRLDRANNNTYRTWQKLGEATPLTEEIVAALQEASRLTPTERHAVPVSDGAAVLSLELKRHSMLLVEIGRR